MDEIEIRTARCVQVEVPLDGRRRRPIDACVPATARFCDCKVWLARTTAPDVAAIKQVGCYVFFGFETDTAMATHLYAVTNRAAVTETAGEDASGATAADNNRTVNQAAAPVSYGAGAIASSPNVPWLASAQ